MLITSSFYLQCYGCAAIFVLSAVWLPSLGEVGSSFNTQCSAGVYPPYMHSVAGACSAVAAAWSVQVSRALNQAFLRCTAGSAHLAHSLMTMQLLQNLLTGSRAAQSRPSKTSSSAAAAGPSPPLASSSPFCARLLRNDSHLVDQRSFAIIPYS